MPKTIISDTSCFINLTNIQELGLLQKIYGEVVTTNEVVTEYGEPLPNWVQLKSASDKYRQQILELQLDKGESSAISLALETPECVVTIDDFKARKVAQHLGLNITGTLGVIIKAKLQGLIPSVKPLLNKIKKTDFRVSEDLEMLVLKEAGEL